MSVAASHLHFKPDKARMYESHKKLREMLKYEISLDKKKKKMFLGKVGWSCEELQPHGAIFMRNVLSGLTYQA